MGSETLRMRSGHVREPSLWLPSDTLRACRTCSGVVGARAVGQEFLVFLNEQFVCNYNCTELKIYTEIHALWEVYQKLHPE